MEEGKLVALQISITSQIVCTAPQVLLRRVLHLHSFKTVASQENMNIDIDKQGDNVIT